MAPKRNQHSESYAKNKESQETSILSRLNKSIEKNIRDQLIIKLILETGCKAHELTEIKAKDIEFTTDSISIGSGAKKRKTTISKELGNQLRHLANRQEEYLFGSRQSKKLTARRIMQLVKHQSKAILGEELSTRDAISIQRGRAFSKAKGAEEAKAIKKETGLKSLRTREILTIEQEKGVRKKIKDKLHQVMFDILLETGCLLSELVSIKSQDVDVKDRQITFSKIKFSKRISKISQGLSLRLKDMVESLSQDEFLFSTRQSPRMSEKRAFQIIRGYARKAGIQGVGPQTIRNTMVARAMEQGISASEIQRQTGIKHLDMHHYGVSVAKTGRKDE
ncbi:site-specific integrase [Candidatus Woesearchaeota archaeon]|nr:site-specific integrase [Candidatus Woesearchaeota archaeon]